MPTKRHPIKRQKFPLLTPEAVQAFRDGDAMALALALKLMPWEISPLNVQERPEPDLNNCDDYIWLSSWKKAMGLRHRLCHS